MNLYLDVDYTLLKYDRKTDEATPNLELLGAVEVYRNIVNPERIFVWSTGGWEYAHETAIMLGLFSVLARDKDPSLLKPYDVVVDDRLEFEIPDIRVEIYTPEDFAEKAVWEWREEQVRLAKIAEHRRG